MGLAPLSCRTRPQQWITLVAVAAGITLCVAAEAKRYFELHLVRGTSSAWAEAPTLGLALMGALALWLALLCCRQERGADAADLEAQMPTARRT
eukprot:CAMPEP_0181178216 /NCGR_PEP_ID=MMETSP1096-20121128/5604_1 /TAXON_ID=156174 ORGANISM="Chrysochromulina ericina, Strain CCMP281" /NCGR_SAMPLE_ID=MMETSP1096 /ASSEMBLY_ACC=CAM_ASM_000453 /LENGTH=93 /DNA_ID=CAMNT_0023266475 /DNA_START=400 /DNA_END=679 /DNA_ORIENTATION=+